MLILTINSGSSSIKFSIYEFENGLSPGRTSETRIASGEINGIGLSKSGFSVRTAETVIHKNPGRLPDHAQAMERLRDWLESGPAKGPLKGVGHRVVHGGIKFKNPHMVTDDLLTELKKLRPLAPNHLPHEILAIETFASFLPGIKQVACFDTSFHSAMPEEARTYPLPACLRDDGIVRYGFHGLSYEYIMSKLEGDAPSTKYSGRVIIAHLGHGASMAAVKDGRCMDTTMGFTPAGGLMMSTRPGDIDPGVILYLLAEKDMKREDVADLVYKRSGLLGVSETSPDMKELLEKAKGDPKAASAISLFCYQARKFIGAFTAALGGLDTLVFTGGIGENAPYVREKTCEGLECLGITIDHGLNKKNDPVISAPKGRVAIRIIKTDEELMVARHAHNLLT